MQYFYDLNEFLRKPLTIKGLDGRNFIIPGQIPTIFAVKFNSFLQKQDKVAKGELEMPNDEEVLKNLKEIVLEIINLDKSQKFTAKDVDKSFDDLAILGKVVEIMATFIYKLESSPNLESPQSK